MIARKHPPRIMKPAGFPRERADTLLEESDAVEDVLVQLLRSNKSYFYSDLPKLFKAQRMESDAVHVRRFELGAWARVLSYLSGRPTAVSDHDQVERMLRDHRSKRETG